MNEHSQGSHAASLLSLYGLIHTIPYHTIPYHIIPYHTIPCHTILYHMVWFAHCDLSSRCHHNHNQHYHHQQSKFHNEKLYKFKSETPLDKYLIQPQQPQIGQCHVIENVDHHHKNGYWLHEPPYQTNH